MVGHKYIAVFAQMFAQTDVTLSHSGRGLFACVSIYSSCATLCDQPLCVEDTLLTPNQT